ncbi:MAG: ABC transporter permease, partial [Thermomicrobiaceae bacterium]
MLNFIIRRLLYGIVVIFLISIATYGLQHLAPGDPVNVLVGEAQVTEEQLDLIRQRWGLDRPWYEQYWTWLTNMLKGDFGVSMVRTGVPVSEMLLEAAPVTFKLNAWAFAIATLVAIPVGVLAAVRRNSWLDYSSMVGATLGVSIPSFWLALVVIIIFALNLGWLPSTGMGSWKHYIMPVGVLAIEQMALIARLSRSSTLEVLRQDYVNTAV